MGPRGLKKLFKLPVVTCLSPPPPVIWFFPGVERDPDFSSLLVDPCICLFLAASPSGVSWAFITGGANKKRLTADAKKGEVTFQQQ